MNEPAETGSPGVTHLAALGRVATGYCLVQLISLLVLQRACSSLVLGEVWVHGALGPLAAVKAIPRFQYHSARSNTMFVLVSLTVLAAPMAYVVRPRLQTMIVSAIALVSWCLFGLGFSIDHM